MAMQRAYYGQDRDREYFERVFQSANINFLIGSGASLPAIRILGDIEAQLEEHVRSGDDLAYFQQAGDFLTSVWEANDVLLDRTQQGIPHSQPTLDNVLSLAPITPVSYTLLKRFLPKEELAYYLGE